VNANHRARPALRERVVLAALLGGCAILLVQQDWLWRWDRVFYDALLGYWQRPAPDDVIIIAIDEASLSEFGRWPWSRRMHAQLLRSLQDERPKAIAFDIIFAEPNLQDPEGDTWFADAIRANGKVVLPVLMEQPRTRGQPIETMPLPELIEAAAALGHVHVELDPDGIARGLYLYEGVGGPYWPHLSLALLQVGEPSHELPKADPSGDHRGSPMIWFRSDSILIPFAGPPEHFPHVSYRQVLSGNFVPGAFDGKYIVVGTTAAGLGDALPTPVSGFSRSMSGAEINANVLAALRAGLRVRPVGTHWRALLSMILALLPVALFPIGAPRTNLLITLLLLTLTLAMSAILLAVFHRWMPPTAALLAISVSYPIWSWRRLELAMRYLSQELDRLQEQQSQLEAARMVTPDAALRFFASLLPVDGWILLDVRNGKALAKGGITLPRPPANVPREKWLHQGSSLWTRLARTDGDALLGLHWSHDDAPDGAQEQFLSRLFDLPATSAKSRIERAETDLGARIAQVQHATRQLRELRRFVEDSLSNMTDGVVVVGTFGQVLLSNPHAAWYLMGNQDAKLSDSPVDTLLHNVVLDEGGRWPDLLRESMLARARVQAGGRQRDGRDLLIQLAPLGVNAESTSGLVINISDISVLRASERKRNEVLNFLSHDLRAPLVSTNALIDLARDARPLPEIRELLDRMESYTARALGLAEQFLQLARAESADAFALRDVDLVGIAQNALEQVWGHASREGIRLEQHAAFDEAWIKGDAGLLERALVNLLDNAVKYSGTGATVELVLSRDNGELRCCVTDHGIGIPASEIPHLFKRFHRVQRAGIRAPRGAGLGLAFVNVVANRHGGHTEVESCEGHGSRFCLILPYDPSEDQEEPDYSELAQS